MNTVQGIRPILTPPLSEVEPFWKSVAFKIALVALSLLLGFCLAGVAGLAITGALGLGLSLSIPSAKKTVPIHEGPFDLDLFQQRLKEKGLTEKNCGGRSEIYLTSNEFGIKKVRDQMQSMEKIEGGVHFGLFTLHNWDLIVQMRSSLAILADYNRKTVSFNRTAIEFLKISATPQDFIAQLLAHIQTDPSLYSKNYRYELTGTLAKETPLIDAITYDLDRMLHRENGAFSPENFPYLVQLAQEGKLFPIELDMTDSSALNDLADLLHEQGAKVSSIYLANAYDFIRGSTQQAKFKQSVRALAEEQTLVIDSAWRHDQKLIKSYVRYGSEYDPDLLRDPIANPDLNIPVTDVDRAD